METQLLTVSGDLVFIVPDEPRETQAWQVVVAVADMIQYPVSSVRVVSVAGRFYFVDYQPYRRPDPSMVLMIGSEGMDFNRLVRRFITVKAQQSTFDPKEWYRHARPYVNAFLGALDRVEALPQEKGLVMDWVSGIVCQMK